MSKNSKAIRFNENTRRTLLSNIMAGVPEVSYASQMRDRLTVVAVDLLPPAVRKVWDDPATQGYVRVSSFYDCCMSFMLPGVRETESWKADHPAFEDAEYKRLHKLHDAQRDARSELWTTIHTAVYACANTRQFATQYPDLIKFLPPEATPDDVSNLPATTAVMDALKAAGFKD